MVLCTRIQIYFNEAGNKMYLQDHSQATEHLCFGIMPFFCFNDVMAASSKSAIGQLLEADLLIG